MQKATGWLRNGFEFAISSTEARKFGQIVLRVLEVPLPCTCQHHLEGTTLKQCYSRLRLLCLPEDILAGNEHEFVCKLQTKLLSPKSGGRLEGPALALVRPLGSEDKTAKAEVARQH